MEHKKWTWFSLQHVWSEFRLHAQTVTPIKVMSINKTDPTLYYGTKQLYFGRINFKFTGSGNHPPWEDLLQKKTQVDKLASEANCESLVNPRLTNPLTVCRRLHQNAKQSDRGI